jgi:hypothetical protein
MSSQSNVCPSLRRDSRRCDSRKVPADCGSLACLRDLLLRFVAGAEEQQLELQRKHKERLKEKEERAEVLRAEHEAKRKAHQERIRVQQAETERRKLEDKRRQEEAVAVRPNTPAPCLQPSKEQNNTLLNIDLDGAECMKPLCTQAKRKALADEEVRRKDKRVAEQPSKRQHFDNDATQNMAGSSVFSRTYVLEARLPVGWRQFTDPATQRE